jgi:hypothetical protein
LVNDRPTIGLWFSVLGMDMVSEYDEDTHMSIKEKELLVESLYQQYLSIHADTKGNPFIMAWDNITFKDVPDGTFSSDSDQQMISLWFEPIMELD